MRAWARAGRTEQTALVACGVAAALLAAVAVAAWRVTPPPQPAPAGPIVMPPALARAADPAVYEAVDAVVASDPFRPEREAAPVPYRLPGEAAGPAEPYVAALRSPPPTEPGVRVEGIVAGARGGLVALGLPGVPARLLRVGDSLGGLRVARIAPGVVMLDGADTTLVLRLRDPGAVGSPGSAGPPASSPTVGAATPPAPRRPLRMVRQVVRPP